MEIGLMPYIENEYSVIRYFLFSVGLVYDFFLSVRYMYVIKLDIFVLNEAISWYEYQLHVGDLLFSTNFLQLQT